MANLKARMGVDGGKQAAEDLKKMGQEGEKAYEKIAKAAQKATNASAKSPTGGKGAAKQAADDAKEAADAADGSLGRLSRAVAGLKAAFSGLSLEIKSSGNELDGLKNNGTRIVGAIGRIRDAATTAVTAIGGIGTAMTAAAAHSASQVAKEIKTIDNDAASLGMDTGLLSGLEYAGKALGGEAGLMTEALKELSDRTMDLRIADRQSAEEMQTLSYEWQKRNRDVAKSVNLYNDLYERARLANAMLGMPGNDSAHWRAELELVVPQLRDAYDTLSDLSVQNFEASNRMRELKEGAEDVQVAFRTLGVNPFKIDGSKKDMLTLFLEVAESVSKMPKGEDISGAVWKAFGDEVGEKVYPLLRDGPEAIKKFVREAEEMGAIITPEQVKRSKDYTTEMARLKGVFSGMRLQIGTELLPELTKVAKAFASWAVANRGQIISTIVWGVKLLTKGFQFLFGLISKNRTAIGEFLTKLSAWAIQLGVDIWRLVTGEGYLVSTENRWLLTVAKVLKGIKTLVTEAWGVLFGDMTWIDGVQHQWLFAVKAVGQYVIGLVKSIADALSGVATESMDRRFAWVGRVRDWFVELAHVIDDYVIPAWKAVKPYLDDFAKKLGLQDAGDLVMLVAIMRLTGLLGGLRWALLGVWNLLRGVGGMLLWAFGSPALRAIGVFLGTSGLGGITAALGTIGTAIGTAIAGWPILIGLALAAAGVIIYQNWDAIVAKAAEVWDWFKGMFPNLGTWAEGAAKRISDAFEWALNGVKGFWQDYLDHGIVLALGQAVKDIGKNLVLLNIEIGKYLADQTVQTIETIIKVAGVVLPRLKDMFIKMNVEVAKYIVNGLINSISTLVSAIVEGAIQGAKAVVGVTTGYRGSQQSAVPDDTWNPTHFKAGGGAIFGPGTSTSDSIPAMLSNGEFVVRAKAVAKYGLNWLYALNNMTLPVGKFADGGAVMSVAGGGGSMSGMSLVLDGQPYQMAAERDVIEALQRGARRTGRAKVTSHARWR